MPRLQSIHIFPAVLPASHYPVKKEQASIAQDARPFSNLNLPYCLLAVAKTVAAVILIVVFAVVLAAVLTVVLAVVAGVVLVAVLILILVIAGIVIHLIVGHDITS